MQNNFSRKSIHKTIRASYIVRLPSKQRKVHQKPNPSYNILLCIYISGSRLVLNPYRPPNHQPKIIGLNREPPFWLLVEVHRFLCVYNLRFSTLYLNEKMKKHLSAHTVVKFGQLFYI